MRVGQANAGEKVAISIEGPYCGKTFKAGDFLYTFINRQQAQILKEKCSQVLSEEELGLLDEIMKINAEKMF